MVYGGDSWIQTQAGYVICRVESPVLQMTGSHCGRGLPAANVTFAERGPQFPAGHVNTKINHEGPASEHGPSDFRAQLPASPFIVGQVKIQQQCHSLWHPCCSACLRRYSIYRRTHHTRTPGVWSIPTQLAEPLRAGTGPVLCQL